jgi:hypothetical protein
LPNILLTLIISKKKNRNRIKLEKQRLFNLTEEKNRKMNLGCFERKEVIN